jgi:hypothetical protein
MPDGRDNHSEYSSDMGRKRPRRGRPRPPERIKLIWECVPDPDPEALLKAVSMLFNRGPWVRRNQESERPRTGEELRLF